MNLVNTQRQILGSWWVMNHVSVWIILLRIPVHLSRCLRFFPLPIFTRHVIERQRNFSQVILKVWRFLKLVLRLTFLPKRHLILRLSLASKSREMTWQVHMIWIYMHLRRHIIVVYYVISVIVRNVNDIYYLILTNGHLLLMGYLRILFIILVLTLVCLLLSTLFLFLLNFIQNGLFIVLREVPSILSFYFLIDFQIKHLWRRLRWVLGLFGFGTTFKNIVMLWLFL